MILEINQLSAKETLLEEEVSFSSDEYKYVSPLLDIKSCKVKVYASSYADFIRVRIYVDALLSLESSYTLKPFDYKLDSDEEYHFSSQTNEDEETIIIKGKNLNLDPYIFNLISASIPMSVHKEGEKLPSGGKDYRVVDEDEYYSKEEENLDPRLSKLDEIDFD